MRISFIVPLATMNGSSKKTPWFSLVEAMCYQTLGNVLYVDNGRQFLKVNYIEMLESVDRVGGGFAKLINHHANRSNGIEKAARDKF